MAQPIKKYQQGGISISVWENEGNKSKTFTLQKSYKKKGSDEWNRSNINFFIEEGKRMKQVFDEFYKDFGEEMEKKE